MSARTTRIMALVLPVLMFGVLAASGGWRIQDGRIERVGHVSASAAPVVASQPSPASAGQAAFVDHLTPSVPWPVLAALLLLCILPAVASMLTWSGSRRGREGSYSVTGGST